jgi:O-antigen/teichoic acid export membrane protein
MPRGQVNGAYLGIAQWGRILDPVARVRVEARPASTLMSSRSQPPAARLLHNIIWQAGGEAASRLIGFAISILLARTLGVEAFGIFGTAFAIVGYVAVLVAAGSDLYGTRALAQGPEDAAELVGRVSIARLLFATCCAVLIAVLAPAMATGSHLVVLLIAATSLFTLALNLNWALRALEQGRTLAIGVMLQHMLFGLLVLLFWRVQNLDARFAAAALVLGECFLVAWNLRAVRAVVGKIHFRRPGAETFAIMRGASAVLVARLPRMLFYQGDIVLVSWLASAAAAGEYVAGQRIVLSLAMVAVLVQWGVFPHASRLAARDRPGFFSFQCAIVRYLLLVLVPVSMLGFVFAPDLVQILYGAAYAEASGALRWLFCALPVFSVSLIVQDSLFALHRNTTVMIANYLAMTLHLAAAITLIPQQMGTGAAIACLGGEAAGLVALLTTLSRDTGWSPAARRAARRCLAPLVAGGAMAISLAVSANLAPTQRLAASLGVFVVACVLVRALARDEIAAVADFLRRRSVQPER